MTQDRNPHEIRNRIFRHMRDTRGSKYLAMIAVLRFANIISRYFYRSPERGELVESYYVMMRDIDDVVDGDKKRPERFASGEDFVKDKIDLSIRLRESPAEAQLVDDADYLMKYCYGLAARLGFSIDEETNAILSSMLFDARRLDKFRMTGEIKAYPRHELDEHFNDLDIIGTISGIIKVRGGYSERISGLLEAVKPLGTACRRLYTMQDYHKEGGLPNIPSEDIDKYGISTEELLLSGSGLERILRTPKLKPRDLAQVLPLPVQNWFLQEARTGLSDIREYKRRIAEVQRTTGRIDGLSYWTLYLMYEVPANRFFRGVITNLGWESSPSHRRALLPQEDGC